MTLSDLLQEARSELDMIESAPSTFGTAARVKARERVRLLDRAVRVEAAARALAGSRVSQSFCGCPECELVLVLEEPERGVAVLDVVGGGHGPVGDAT